MLKLNNGDNGSRIIVVGDVMLDVYICGSAERISPEAPVPVVDVSACKSTLGGAGNVALNLVGLKHRVSLFGVRGNDVAGQKLWGILRESGIADGLLVDKAIPTTSKTRVVANRQQLVRFDEERKLNGSSDVHYGHLMESVLGYLDHSIGAVVLSDYDKGVLSMELASSVINRCNELGIISIVDPKRGDWEAYRGATWAKPNLLEFREVVGDAKITDVDDILAASKGLMSRYGIGNLLVTLGPRGMLIVVQGGYEYIGTTAKEVFDVSGAGDTTVAVMASCLCSGYSPFSAARIANLAAGVVVGKVGTYQIQLSELEAAMRAQ